MMFVAIRTFRDESDGDLIEAGLTHVTREADCYRAHPENFKPATRDLCGPIQRVGGTAAVLDKPRPRCQPPRRPATQRPSWQLGSDPLTYKDVELRLRGYVDYSVSLGSENKRDILAEITRAHQAAGEAVEAAGWLFSQWRPRADHNQTPIALITRSIERSGTRGEVYLSDPHSAITAVRNAGYEHLELVGDWHSHCVPGSELPSLQDARAWAGTMDSLGREAYVSLIVSPSPEMGWSSPKVSAWVAGRYGSPSRPVVGRASMPWS